MDFFSSEKLEILRSQGKLGLSVEAARYFSIIVCLVFLFSQNFITLFEQLLSANSIELTLELFLILLEKLIGLLVIYLTVFLISILIQSRFYFSFNKRKTIKNERKQNSISKLFSFAAIIKIIFIFGLLFVSSWLWLIFVPELTILLLGYESFAVLDQLSSIFETYINAFLALLTFVALALILIAKVQFRLENAGGRE